MAHSSRTRGDLPAPAECWYALAASADVDHALSAYRALGVELVMFRTSAGVVSALEDRCSHRGFPLSQGRLVDDDIHCGLCGFVFDAAGTCVLVPTQPRVPMGADVRAYPVRESDGLVWVWFGEPGRAGLTRIPDLAHLASSDWSTVGATVETAAGFLLLHEGFADVTQVPVIAPEVTPVVLQGDTPPLEVVVTETTVSLARRFPAGPLPRWQAAMLGVGPDEAFEHVQEGHFRSPAVWVDHWDVELSDRVARMRFTHLLTPIDRSSTRLMWRVSRDFAVDDIDASRTFDELFRDYYGRATRAMETLQRVRDTDGPRREVSVSADVAALKVRSIVAALAEESGHQLRP